MCLIFNLIDIFSFSVIDSERNLAALFGSYQNYRKKKSSQLVAKSIDFRVLLNDFIHFSIYLFFNVSYGFDAESF